jgi:HlyD family secretion protein
MSASADIQTNTHTNVLTVAINAVTTRDKSDTGSVSKSGKADKPKDVKTDQPQNDASAEVAKNADDLDEVVFVLQKDGTVKRVKVRTDIQHINFIEVVDGLKEGDEVITGPYTTVSKLLRNGMKVKVVPKEELFEVKK